MIKVMVTGIGAVTPIGVGREELWRGIQESRVGIRRISRFNPEKYHCQVAGEVVSFEPRDWISADRAAGMDRFSRFLAASGRMAVADAALDLHRTNPQRVGCFVGSALGGVGLGELQYQQFHHHGAGAVDSLLAAKAPISAGTSSLSTELNIRGPVSGNADSCASGPIAIGRAVQSIRRGELDLVIAGGAEASLTPLAFGAFDLIRAMSSHYNDRPSAACRPFDRDRDGFVMGEGAALLVLESEEHARSRRAEPLAELAGFGITNDAFHMTAPRPDALQASRAIGLALQDAGASPADIDVISAHGSGTALNDPTETLAIKKALGERAWQIPVIGTKSRHAHSLGATGAIEAALFSLALYHQWLPACMNLDRPDPNCDLDYGRGCGAPRTFRTVLSNSFGFGGINACLVLRRAEGTSQCGR